MKSQEQLTAEVLAYARLERMQTTATTPRYTMVSYTPDFAPFERMTTARGKNKGTITMRLCGLNVNYKSIATSMFLEVKGTNFTGLKPVGTDNAVFYGYPNQDTEMFKQYPLCAYLIIAEYDNDSTTPKAFEILVLNNARGTIKQCAEMQRKGAFNNILNQWRGKEWHERN